MQLSPPLPRHWDCSLTTASSPSHVARSTLLRWEKLMACSFLGVAGAAGSWAPAVSVTAAHQRLCDFCLGAWTGKLSATAFRRLQAAFLATRCYASLKLQQGPSIPLHLRLQDYFLRGVMGCARGRAWQSPLPQRMPLLCLRNTAPVAKAGLRLPLPCVSSSNCSSSAVAANSCLQHTPLVATSAPHSSCVRWLGTASVTCQVALLMSLL